MYAIPDLEKITGFTENQIRDRLGLLSAILGDDLQRGHRGKILVGDKAVSALRRMVELEREGLSPRVAQDRIIKEMGNGDQKVEMSPGEPWRSLVEELQDRVRSLERDKERFLQILEAKEDQLRALMPGPGSRQPEASNGGQAMTRWRALRYAILGR